MIKLLLCIALLCSTAYTSNAPFSETQWDILRVEAQQKYALSQWAFQENIHQCPSSSPQHDCLQALTACYLQAEPGPLYRKNLNTLTTLLPLPFVRSYIDTVLAHQGTPVQEPEDTSLAELTDATHTTSKHTKHHIHVPATDKNPKKHRSFHHTRTREHTTKPSFAQQHTHTTTPHPLCKTIKRRQVHTHSPELRHKAERKAHYAQTKRQQKRTPHAKR